MTRPEPAASRTGRRLAEMGYEPVLLPLAGGRRAAQDGSSHDLAVYRDQLSELDGDLARGLIQPAEAEQARAEIGRRILRLEGGGDAQAGAARSAPAFRFPPGSPARCGCRIADRTPNSTCR